MAKWVINSLERFQVPQSWVPLPSTSEIISGVMKPLLTPVGVTKKRSGARRQEMFPPFPSQYSRIQMRRPMSQICCLRAWASGELKSFSSALAQEPAAGAAGVADAAGDAQDA